MKENDDRRPAHRMGTLLFLIVGFSMTNGIISGLISISSLLLSGIEIHSIWSLFLVSNGLMVAILISIFIDGVFAQFNEGIRGSMQKTMLLFLSKVLEVMVIVVILHQVDIWLKGIECSTMSEALIGYITFLFMESLFWIGTMGIKNKQKNRDISD